MRSAVGDTVTVGDPVTIVAIAVIVFVAATFQASIGFGANVIAQPIVYLIEPRLVPGSILLATAMLSAMVMARDRQSIGERPMTGVIAGILVGTAIGVLTVRAASPDAMAIVIAVIVLVMVALLATDRLQIEPTPVTISLAALVGGFSGTTSGIGGPPMALVYQRAEGPTIRGSLASYFILATAVALGGLALAGRFGWSELAWGLALFPVVLAAFVASHRMLAIVDRGYARPAILSASALAAIILLGRTLLG